jgi:endonuclease I
MLKRILIFCFVAGAVAMYGQYTVSFEGPSEIKPAYASGTVQLSGLDWDMTEALIGDLATDFKNGERSARLRGYAASSMTMLEDKTGGLGNLSFLYRRYGTDDQVDWKVEYSADGGSNWIQIGEAFTAPASDVVQTFSEDVNLEGNIRIRILRATPSGDSNKRLNIDDITLTDYSAPEGILITGSLEPFSTTEGDPSPAQSYHLQGAGLAQNIDISVPNGFEISVDSGASYVTQASLPPSFDSDVLVRMTGETAGTFGGDIVHSSAGFADALLPVAGTVGGQGGYAEDLFFSEYIEGSSYNKALEIFNGTGSGVDLSDYRIEVYFNGNPDPSAQLDLSGTLSNNGVYVLAHSSADPAILAVTDITNNYVVNFNGNDAIALRKISTNGFLDIFGVIGDDPGSAWTDDGGYSTSEKTLVRQPSVVSGITTNPSGTGPEAFTTLATEWDLYPADTFADLGAHTFEGGGEEVDPPTLQASQIVSFPTSSTVALEWTPGDGTRRIVKVNTANSFTPPADGTNPSADPAWNGSGEQVVFNGATQIIEGLPFNGCEVTNLEPLTTYWFRVYEYNGTGSYTRFLTTTATGNPSSATTLEQQGMDYYADIYGFGSTLKSNLHELLRTTHTTQYSYSALLTQIPYTDEDPANVYNIIEIYTGWSVNKDDFGGGTADWNREHTWSKSHGDFGDTAPAGTDLHHLRPCDSTVNSAKSNKDFDAGGSAYTDSSPPSGYSGDTGCYTTADTWEPRDEDKGDTARMIMYMAVRYEGTDTSYDLEIVDHVYTDAGENLPYYGKLAMLLNWHVQDPPDAREAQRNERIHERQGNRNPFIDVPVYAQYIWSPVPLYSSDVSSSAFTGWWSSPISATSYQLQLATDSLFTNPVPGYGGLNIGLATSWGFSGLDAGQTYYYRLRAFFEDDFGMYSPFLAVTLSDPAAATAQISPDQPLEEYWLDSAVLDLELFNATFADNILQLSNFTLEDAPPGLYIQSIGYLASAAASLTLGFDGTDFDVNFENFCLTIAASELSVDYPVTSDPIAITAHLELAAEISLDGALVRLDIPAVPGATAYRVFASPEPYGEYTEITSAGEFDPIQNNIWRIDPALADRRFFFATAITE